MVWESARKGLGYLFRQQPASSIEQPIPVYFGPSTWQEEMDDLRQNLWENTSCIHDLSIPTPTDLPSLRAASAAERRRQAAFQDTLLKLEAHDKGDRSECEVNRPGGSVEAPADLVK